MMDNEAKHIAIILDGNRRFAKKNMINSLKGHEHGAEAVDRILNDAQSLDIKQMTLYCLSVENIQNRSEKELDYLFDIGEKWFKGLDRERLARDGVKINFIGDLSLVRSGLRNICLELEKETADNSNYIINFALAYGGRQEIISCIKKIVEKGIDASEVDEQSIKDNLYLSDEPDIIIRTGGDVRMSNFLPWQSVYSEWFFLDKLWPEFTKEDLISCIDEFKNRKRNFGK